MSGRRWVVGLLLGLAVGLLALDGVPTLWGNIAAEDNALACAQKAATVARGQPVNPATALTAWQAAQARCDEFRATVAQEGFLLAANGNVTLTYQDDVSSVVFKYLPGLRDLVVIRKTVTSGPLEY